MRDMAEPLKRPPTSPGRPLDLLGDSEQMEEVRDLIARVAETDVTVLIRGESGTGKELVARALHRQSTRRDRPFIKVNCAALPADLLESEMFGFERGAFSGALQAKPGKFEFANHGTIFLDEIGEMSPSLQAKLLHVLQDGQFSRLGGQADVKVDVRIVAATNRRLEEAVAIREFREDLYFRLNVVCITMPPLRERRQEIPTLVTHFLERYSAHYSRPNAAISRDTLDLFMHHDWPGNVRELENVIQRMVILGPESADRNPLAWMPEARTPSVRIARPVQMERRASTFSDTRAYSSPPLPEPPTGAPNDRSVGRSVGRSDVPGAGADATAFARTGRDADRPIVPAPTSLKVIGRNAARAAEREMILRMLHRTRWNRKEAAEILGISYKALLYKIKENRLDDPVSDLEPRALDSAGRR